MNVKLLKQKNFLLLVLGGFVSVLGSDMQNFILSLYVLSLTGSGTKFASVLAIGIVPKIILGPFAGVFADRFDRKKMMVGLDLLSGITVGVFALIYSVNDGLSLSYIYVLVILLSLISIFFSPVDMAILPSIVRKEDLTEANSINFGIARIASLIAPMIGAALYGVFGLFIILIINSTSFILAGISEIFIAVPKNAKSDNKFTVKNFFSDFSEGFRFVLSSKIIRSVILLGIFLNFAGTPMIGLINTYILKQVIKVSDMQLGLLESIMMVAMFTAPFICNYLSKKMKVINILYLDNLIMGFIILSIALISSPLYINLFNSNFAPFVSMGITCLLISILCGINNILLGTILQQETPNFMMGRVSSVLGTLLVIATPLGQMVFGVLLDKIPVYICVAIVSTIIIASSIMFKNLTSSPSKKLEIAITEE
ncbi:MAG TPA: MFS transporter [Clostridium sp.]|nr:MFS transporter [Clostridium sp.]